MKKRPVVDRPDPDYAKVVAKYGKPVYLMPGKTVHTTHGICFRIRVYDLGTNTFDAYTVCVDGGYDDLRFAWGASQSGIAYFAGDMYGQRGIKPGPHLGKRVWLTNISDELWKSIIQYLDEGWA
jgi:hypothetical protein